ncbi:MAG: cupin domain-containing protein [Candidatus Dormibacteraeota bacterium]|nr:cupin domain-containing protein [Candidatus Dormibacteraeota bacterium]
MTKSRWLLEPGAGESVSLGGIGVHFKIFGRDTGGRFSIVEHPVAPRVLVPSHVHHNEDEYSYVVSGLIGVRVGDDIFDARAGSYVLKPREIPHTFWNPTDEPVLLVEIIAPAGFEQQFAEMGQWLRTGPITPEFGAGLSRRYHIDNAPDTWNAWIRDLTKEHRLVPAG